VSRQPYIEEARSRLASARKETNKHGFLEEEIVQLMADYAAESWQEGYDEGYSEGHDEGYSAGEYDNQD
jgi:flagellar biosynthesis/type III secretory pathway protein FliH